MDDSLIEYMKDYSREGKHVPLLTLIKISSKCNAKCFMCSNWKKPEQGLELYKLLEVVDELKDLGCKEIRITGGEPTISNNFESLVKKIREKELELSFITNGGGRDEVFERAIFEGAKRIYLSIDSPFAETHNRLRNTDGLFESAMKKIDIINYYKDQGVNVISTINHVVSRYNVNDLEEMGNLCIRKNIDELNIIPVKGIRDAFLNPDEIKRFNENILYVVDTMNNNGVKLKGKNMFVFGETDDEIILASEGNYTGSFYIDHPCFVSSYSAFIDEKGNVFPCSNTPYMGEEFNIGNINENSLIYIWDSEKAKKIRYNGMNGILSKCISCDNTNMSANRIMCDSYGER